MTDLYRIQTKLAIVLASSGILVSFINIISLMKKQTFSEALMHHSVSVLFFISLIVLFFGFIDASWARMVQTGFVAITGIIAIKDVYNSIHGLGLILLSSFIAFKYGFFRTRPILKAVITVLATAAAVEYSARTQSLEQKILYSMGTIIYMALFLIISYLIYSDEIKAYIKENRSVKDEIVKLERKSRILSKRKAEVDARLAELITPADLDAMGISPAEKRVIEALVVYGETEQMMAQRLNLSFHTVKAHLRNIRDKLGVDRREEIIEICRNNFR